MISQDFLNNINAAYHQLETKRDEIFHILNREFADVRTGWYNGHYHIGEEGNWSRNAYPIPEVNLMGLCDIEIYFDHISVTAKLRRDAALAYSFDKLMEYEWEAYGIENYLSDYYHTGRTVHEMKNAISSCDENEIGFSITMPFETEGMQIFELAQLLSQEGFYY